MSKESKTARPDQPLIRALKHLQLREAIASVKLNGDTSDCAKCKANIRKQVIKEIKIELEKAIIEDCPIEDCSFASMCSGTLSMSEECRWWQQFWERWERCFETMDGKWWLFEGGKSIRPLTDEEAVGVIWGQEERSETQIKL